MPTLFEFFFLPDTVWTDEHTDTGYTANPPLYGSFLYLGASIYL